MTHEKPCARPGCAQVVHARDAKELARRKYCSRRCNARMMAGKSACVRHEKAMRCAIDPVRAKAEPYLLAPGNWVILQWLFQRVWRAGYRRGYKTRLEREPQEQTHG